MWTKTAQLVGCLMALTLSPTTAFEGQREIGSVQDYLAYRDVFVLDIHASRLLGLIGINGRSKLDYRWIDGISIIKVFANSPAASAGLRERQEIVVMKGAVHHNFYDLIVAVDGEQGRDIMDVNDRLRNFHSNTIVYLTNFRDGRPLQ